MSGSLTEEENLEADRFVRTFWSLEGALVAALAMGAALIVVGLWPQRVVLQKEADFTDAIFASRIVIALIRIALLFVIGYVVISIVARILRGEWLLKAGPFEAEVIAQSYRDDIEFWQVEAADAEDQVDDLKQRIEESAELIAHLYDRLRGYEERDEDSNSTR
jgi:hypothetical protein